MPSTSIVGSSVPPTPLTPLVGRVRELAALGALLAEPSVRLITLTGPGGSGKTRLALEVANRSGPPFVDGVAFVDLAPLADHRLVVAEIARVLGVGDTGGAPVGELLRAALRERRLLLLLDNFEQILPAAAEVAALLGDCPGVVALVTSRAPLGVRGEREFPVPPLPVPSADTPLERLGQEDAATLFVQRARAIDPDFAFDATHAAAIAEICARLDGLPLAIELAAARVRVLSPEALLARLEQRLPLLTSGQRDAPARQRTLRDTIAWSYDLLDAAHQRLFRGLGVFVGHVTLDGAGQIAASTGLDALTGVETLVAHNLLLRVARDAGPPRVRMLETIREYALERLELAGEMAETRAVHADWCLAYAEAVHPPRSLPELPDQKLADRLALEYDNLRAALAWFIDTGQAAPAMRLASILGTLWFLRGYLTEGLDWLERARALPGAVPRPVLASASFMLGVLRVFRGAPDGTLDHLAESLAIYRGLNDPVGLAATHTMMAARADYAGEPAHSQALHERALAQFRRAGDANGIAQCLGNLADLAYQQGNVAAAYACSNEALTWLDRFDNEWTKAFLLSMHTHILLRRGEVDAATPLAGEALERARATESPLSIANVLVSFGHLFAVRREWAQAVAVLGAVDAACTRYGLSTVLHHAQQRQALALAEAALHPSAFEQAWAEGQARSLDQAVADALSFVAEAAAGRRPPPESPDVAAGLTAREVEVLRLITAGRSDRAIAESLFISTRTVTTHVTHILTKLGVDGRAAAAAWAVRHGLA